MSGRFRTAHGLLAAVAAWIGLHPIHEADPFWHMTLGRAVLRHGTRTVPEPSALPQFAPECVVPEWLWGVLTYGLHELAGPVALSLFAAALAALSAWLIARLCMRDATGAQRWAALFVSTLVVCAVFQRMRLRPQAAFLVLLPAFLWGVQAYVSAQGTYRRRAGLSLVALALLWAQLHGSFVLAPALFVLQTAPLDPRNLRAYLREHGPVLLGVTATLLSSAHGHEVLGYVSQHASGDASQYVADLVATSWSALNVVGLPSVGALWLLWLLGAQALLWVRPFPTRALLLALFGGALLADAFRFASAAAVLCAPLSVLGARALVRELGDRARHMRRSLAVVGASVAVAMLGWTAEWMNQDFGPLGRPGFGEGTLPRRAAKVLAKLPAGSPVFSDFVSGASLGFWLDGHVRTFVDGRTPLYFNDTDFALAREALQHRDALARQVRHFGLQAAVVRRDSEACSALQDTGWALVAVDATYSTFAPPGSAPALRGLRACGRDVVQHKCPDPDDVLADVTAMERLQASPFIDYLRASLIIECGGDGHEALELLRRSRPQAREYARAHERMLLRALLKVGDVEPALEILRHMVLRGDLGSLEPLTSPALASVRPAQMRALLQGLADALRDGLPPPVRAELARLCASTGDAECAAFHGLRAAARGEVRVAEVLGWVAKAHPDPRIRQNAAHWQRTLLREGRAGGDAAAERAQEDGPDRSAP